MHTEVSNKVLEWNNFGRKRIYYTETMCGQYYAYRHNKTWKAGRKMFGKDVDFRIEFSSLPVVKAYLQHYENDKVIYVGDPL